VTDSVFVGDVSRLSVFDNWGLMCADSITNLPTNAKSKDSDLGDLGSLRTMMNVLITLYILIGGFRQERRAFLKTGTVKIYPDAMAMIQSLPAARKRDSMLTTKLTLSSARGYRTYIMPLMCTHTGLQPCAQGDWNDIDITSRPCSAIQNL
jgi:hypothetical protein